MNKRTYKVYDVLRLAHQHMAPQLSVLDAGASCNLINFQLVPPALQAHIHCRPRLYIADTNNDLLNTVGYVSFVVRLDTCMVQLDFVVCNKTHTTSDSWF